MVEKTAENIKSKINNQLIELLSRIKYNEKTEIELNIHLQIEHLKEIPKDQKKFYLSTLCDDKYKYNGFLILPKINSGSGNAVGIEKGDIINIKKITTKRVKKGFFVIIKHYSKIKNEEIANGLNEIKEENGEFLDAEGNILIKEKTIENIIIKDDPSINIKSSEEKKEEFVESEPMEEEAYSSLKQLTTFSRDFIIFIRVTKKSDIKIFETRYNHHYNYNPSYINNSNQGKLFYFDVMDKDGNEMQCTCFNKSVDKFFLLIEEGHLYEIKGGYVKLNDKKYSRIKSDYKIVLDENSKIRKIVDNGIIKKQSANFIKIKDIQNMSLYSIIDICVVVLDVGEKMIKNTRNGNQPLKKLIVGDVSKYKIEVSLWRTYSDTRVKFGDILLINNIKIGEFKGRTLTTFDETCIKINPPDTNIYVKELEQFLSKNDLKGEFLELEMISNLNQEKKKENEQNNNNSMHIKEVLDLLDDIDDVKNLSKITATVTQILHNEKNFYGGCADRNCKRKLKYENGEFLCPNCNKSCKIPTYYYTLSLRVKDASCEYWIDIFGKTAESIMKYTAEEYKEFCMNKDENKLKEITDGIEFKIFNFWVKPKLQVYNTISKKKLYAYKIEEIDEKKEAYRLVDFLQKEIF